MGQKHLAHAAFAQALVDPVVREALSDHDPSACFQVAVPPTEERPVEFSRPPIVEPRGWYLYGLTVKATEARVVSQSRFSTPPTAFVSTLIVKRSTTCGNVLTNMSMV